MIKKISLLLIALTFCAAVVWAQTAPAEGIRKNTPAIHALKNLTVVVSPGKKVEKGTIVIRDGVIEAVGANISVPADARIWDGTGLTAYAGFIDLSTDFGQPKPRTPVPGQPSAPPVQFPEPPRGSPYWNSNVHPEISGAEQFLPDKDGAEKLRALGFTTVLTAPTIGIIHGTGALVNLGEGNANSQIIRADVTQNMSFSRDSFGEGYPNSLMGAIALIRQSLYDARWYSDALKAYAKNPSQEKPEDNKSLAVLEPAATGRQTVIFETNDELTILRAGRIAKEFSLSFWIRGNGMEYRRLDAVKETGAPVILPVNFPDPPNVNSPDEALDVSYEDLRYWDFAPENPGRLKQAGVTVALTTATLKDVSKFKDQVHTAIDRGLKFDDALASLTTVPARLLGMERQLGTIEEGKMANFVLTEGELFGEKTKVRETWITGTRYEVKPAMEIDARGKWSYTFSLPEARKDTGTIDIGGEPEAISGAFVSGKVKVKATSAAVTGKKIAFAFDGDSLGYKGIVRILGVVDQKMIAGTGELPDGNQFKWSAEMKSPYVAPPDTVKPPEPVQALLEVVYPDGAFGRKSLPQQPENILVKGGYVWTSGPSGNLENADILVSKGKIAKIGKDLPTPKGTVVIDAKGKHVTPGLIDCHSHIAISEGVNESGQAITAEVRIGDVVNSDDINIYRQLAGGLTASNLLHGSANPIGGQNQVVKLRWGALPEQMKFEGAPPGIKFALGENVKQSNWGDRFTTRYPQTRMGVEQIIRDEFRSALDYEKKVETAKKNPALIPPRRDMELDAVLEILKGTRLVHAHSYRQDEILMLIRAAEDFGFKIQSFQHVLEGYKIAEAIAKHGAGASCFSDWWAYKYEVVDAIPYAGTLMHDVGVTVSFNSDDAEMARRLNQEAAKAVKYGGLSEIEALKFVTINPAKQLRVDGRVGSIEVGKDADFVVWSGSPLSNYSICEQTWIDGRKYFDRDEDREMNQRLQKERAELIQRALKTKKKGTGGGPPSMPPRSSYYSCHNEKGE